MLSNVTVCLRALAIFYHNYKKITKVETFALIKSAKVGNSQVLEVISKVY